MTPTTNSVAIRRAGEDDWPELWSIISTVAASGDTYALEPGVGEVEAKEYWTGSGITAYVAERDDRIVGTYALKANQRGLGNHVANAGYMVHPDLFGRGVGQQLCEHSLLEARNSGFLAMQFNAVVRHKPPSDCTLGASRIRDGW